MRYTPPPEGSSVHDETNVHCGRTSNKINASLIWPHSSAHSGDSSTQRPTLPSRSSIRSFTWWGLETSSWSSSRSLDRPTPQRHCRICSSQPLETGHTTGPWWSDASHATARVGYAMTTTTTTIMIWTIRGFALFFLPRPAAKYYRHVI